MGKANIEEGDLSLGSFRGPLCGDIPIADDEHPAVVLELLEGVRSRLR